MELLAERLAPSAGFSAGIDQSICAAIPGGKHLYSAQYLVANDALWPV